MGRKRGGENVTQISKEEEGIKKDQEKGEEDA